MGNGATRLYVGNLSYVTTKETLEQAFSDYGEVASVDIITDRQSGRAKGFAFVEMGTPEEAEAAKQGLNGRELDGRTINVDNARTQTNREGGSRGTGHGGYGSYGGRFGGQRRGGRSSGSRW